VLQSWFDLLRRQDLLRFWFDLLRQQHLLRVWGCLLQRKMLLEPSSDLLRRRVLPGRLSVLRQQVRKKPAVTELYLYTGLSSPTHSGI